MPQFTAETARIAAAKSHAPDSARFLPPLPEAVKPLDPYIEQRLLRVRKQLNKIDGMIEEELDPAKLDRLASAQARLSEQERQLANRPLPGTLKPQSPKRTKSQSVEPID